MESKIYHVRCSEPGFPFIALDPLTFEETYKLATRISSGSPIGDLWDIRNPQKERDGDFPEFVGISGPPTNLIVIRADVMRNAAIARFFDDPGEFIPISVAGVDFVMYNPTRCFDVIRPEDKGVLYPSFLKQNLPVSGFFRRPVSRFTYYAEPSGGGLRELFYKSGMIGLDFEEVPLLDE